METKKRIELDEKFITDYHLNKKKITDFIIHNIYQDDCKVFLNIITTEYDEGVEIVEIINEILEGVHVDDDGYYFTVRIIDSTEVFENNKYIQILSLVVE